MEKDVSATSLSKLISTRKEELAKLWELRGTDFPVVERQNDLRISFIELELADLEKLNNQPQLNDNQKIVLNHLKKDKKYRPFRSVGFLDYSNGIIHDRPSKEFYEAYKQLDYDQQFEVLAAFAAWGLEQEAE